MRATGLLVALGLALAAAPAAAATVRPRVVIQGLEREAANNVRLTLALVALEGREVDESRARWLHERAPAQIARALEPFGYYRPRVTSTIVSDHRRWTVTYAVDPGEPLRITTAEVELIGSGRDEPEFLALFEGFPLAVGDRLEHQRFEEGRRAISRHATRNGYFEGAFARSRIEVDLDAYTADLTLVFHSGPRARFGPLTVEQDFLSDEVVSTYVDFEEGEPFDYSRLLALQQALEAIPIVGHVEVVPRDEGDGASLDLPIDVRIESGKTQRWTVGGGYATDTGPRIRLGAKFRRLNRHADRLELDAEIATRRSRYLAELIFPRPWHGGLTYRLSGALDDTDSRSRVSQSRIGGVGVSRLLGDQRAVAALSFQKEDWEVGSDEGATEMLVVEGGISRVWADDRIHPRLGGRLRLRLAGASEDVGSEVSFVQAEADWRWAVGLGEHVRFLNRIEVGRTGTPDFRRLPGSVRYFAGGDESVRGWAYEEIGDLDENGEVIGGSNLVTGSVELEALFPSRLGRVGFAVFYDVGSASQEFGAGFEAGAGAGLRLLSPVGMLRTELAWPVSEPGKSPRLHITLGPDL